MTLFIIISILSTLCSFCLFFLLKKKRSNTYNNFLLREDKFAFFSKGLFIFSLVLGIFGIFHESNSNIISQFENVFDAVEKSLQNPKEGDFKHVNKLLYKHDTGISDDSIQYLIYVDISESVSYLEVTDRTWYQRNYPIIGELLEKNVAINKKGLANIDLFKMKIATILNELKKDNIGHFNITTFGSETRFLAGGEFKSDKDYISGINAVFRDLEIEKNKDTDYEKALNSIINNINKKGTQKTVLILISDYVHDFENKINKNISNYKGVSNGEQDRLRKQIIKEEKKNIQELLSSFSDFKTLTNIVIMDSEAVTPSPLEDDKISILKMLEPFIDKHLIQKTNIADESIISESILAVNKLDFFYRGSRLDNVTSKIIFDSTGNQEFKIGLTQNGGSMKNSNLRYDFCNIDGSLLKDKGEKLIPDGSLSRCEVNIYNPHLSISYSGFPPLNSSLPNLIVNEVRNRKMFFFQLETKELLPLFTAKSFKWLIILFKVLIPFLIFTFPWALQNLLNSKGTPLTLELIEDKLKTSREETKKDLEEIITKYFSEYSPDEDIENSESVKKNKKENPDVSSNLASTQDYITDEKKDTVGRRKKGSGNQSKGKAKLPPGK